MQHLTTLDQIHLDGAWITIGSFDGVHKAHQKILRGLVEGAHSAGFPAVAITFHPHPSIVLRGNRGHFYLSTPEERARLLGEQGIDIVLTVEFTREFAATPAADFIGQLNQNLGVKDLWVGYDFALGRGREGDIPTLKRLGEIYDFHVTVIPPVDVDGERISSSLIRNLLIQGDLQKANRMLGRFYGVEGPVIHGDGRGRTIGIPTANLDVWLELVIPAVGVYATWAWVEGKRHPAVTNVGVRPTFENQPLHPRIETLILDFDQDLYGKQLRVEFVEFLRGEQKFASVDALLTQIKSDIQQAQNRLSSYEL